MSLLGRVPVPEPEPGVPPVSWHVQLEQVSLLLLQPQAVMCLNFSAAGLVLDLHASNGLSYQAGGVQALKFGQSVIIGNFRSGHVQICMLFNNQLKMTSSFSPSMSSVWILRFLEQ